MALLQFMATTVDSGDINSVQVEAANTTEAGALTTSASAREREGSVVDYDIIDLRDGNRDLLDQVYADLLSTHFPIADELDDLEDMRTNICKEADGRFPELHILVARNGEALMGCACFEYYPVSNVCLLSYICVSAPFRRQGVAQALVRELEERMERRAGADQLAAILAETHEVSVEDGIMDAGLRQAVLASLGFQCIQFDYTQPPLSRGHNPCGGLRLLVRNKSSLHSAVLISFLDDFAGSVFDYDGSWKNETYYLKQVDQLQKVTLVNATGERPW